MNKTLLHSFIPFDFVKENDVSFYVQDLDIVIDADNWPCNLFYNPDLIEADEMFYEQMCSDTTWSFYVESVAGRCRSLISRAVHNQDITWEHGPIRIFELGGICPEVWMIRTKTEVAIRKLIENERINSDYRIGVL